MSSENTDVDNTCLSHALEAEGRLKRILGGAILNDQDEFQNNSFMHRHKQNVAADRAMVRETAIMPPVTHLSWHRPPLRSVPEQSDWDGRCAPGTSVAQMITDFEQMALK